MSDYSGYGKALGYMLWLYNNQLRGSQHVTTKQFEDLFKLFIDNAKDIERILKQD